jgi:hypothetical protein
MENCGGNIEPQRGVSISIGQRPMKKIPQKTYRKKYNCAFAIQNVPFIANVDGALNQWDSHNLCCWVMVYFSSWEVIFLERCPIRIS